MIIAEAGCNFLSAILGEYWPRAGLLHLVSQASLSGQAPHSRVIICGLFCPDLGDTSHVTRVSDVILPGQADDPLKLQNSALKYPLLELSARYFIQKEELPGLGPLRHPGQI